MENAAFYKLSGLEARVFDELREHINGLTVDDIQANFLGSGYVVKDTAVSAAIRNLRKPKFGSFIVERLKGKNADGKNDSFYRITGKQNA